MVHSRRLWRLMNGARLPLSSVLAIHQGTSAVRFSRREPKGSRAEMKDNFQLDPPPWARSEAESRCVLSRIDQVKG